MIGVDAATPQGQDRVKPLATLAQAHTSAAVGDVIVLMSGHAETLSAAQVFSKAGVVVVSEGSGKNRARFTRNGDINMFDVTAAGVAFWNIYFVASAAVSVRSRLRVAGAAPTLRESFFECGPNDTGPAFETVTGSSSVRVEDTQFLSTGTALTAQPHSAIKVTDALTDLRLESVSISGGTVGWSNQYAFVGAGAITRLRAFDLDLLDDSDMSLVTGTTGYITLRYKTGSARVIWTS